MYFCTKANALFLAEELNDLLRMLDRLPDAVRHMDLQINVLRTQEVVFDRENVVIITRYLNIMKNYTNSNLYHYMNPSILGVCLLNIRIMDGEISVDNVVGCEESFSNKCK